MSLLTEQQTAVAPKRAQEIIFEDAQRIQHEQRLQQRTPLFHPVFITADDGTTYTAFTRDLSKTGIGLLHCMPIEPQETIVRLQRANGAVVSLTVNITWCQSCGEGWYVSGGKLLDAEVCK